MRRRIVTALTLANLCYLRVWRDLLVVRPSDAFALKHAPLPAQYAAAICGVLLLASLILALNELTTHSAPRVRACFLYGCVLILANALRALFATYFPVLRSGLFGIVRPSAAMAGVVILAAAGFPLVYRFRFAVARFGTLTLAVFSPFVVFTFGESLLQMLRHNPDELADKPLAARSPGLPAARVLWVIFDEWDYHLSFVNRPAGLAMPQVDRLRGEALFGTNAFPPSDTTMTSMPSLIYGRRVWSASPTSASRLPLHFKDGGELIFGQDPNIFSRARSMGLNTALFGWYLPYCRTLNASLNECWWNSMQFQSNSLGDTFGEALVNEPRSLLETPIFSVFGQSLATRGHFHTYSDMLERSEAAAADPGIALCLIHFNIPHPQYFYNARTGQPTRGNSPNGYNDGLALVDRTVGELRSAMERAGVWDKTTVLLSADHWFRSSALVNGQRDHRIPFVLRLADQREGLCYDKEFNSVMTSDLLLAILRSEVKTGAEAASWIAHEK
jgi:hypothetical protein